MKPVLMYAILFLSSAVTALCGTGVPGKAYIQHLAIDPQQPQIIYAATTSAGLYKSVDRGENWQRIDNCDTTTAFHVIRIDPRNHNRLICGGRDSGVWISRNQGKTWSRAGMDRQTICDLVFHPRNSNIVYLLARDGVYYSPDTSRKEWKQLFDYLRFQKKHPVPYPHQPWPYSRFQKIAVNPHHPEQIFIGGRWEGGYHRSDDGGKTWQHKWISGMFRRVDPILFHPTDPDRIFVGTHHQGLFVSYNNGKSWISMSRGIAPEKRTPFYGAYLISGLTCDPQNPDILYSGSDFSNWKSVDGGISWQELGATLTCRFARAMAVDPQHPATVYAGTNIGVYRSDNGGNTWAFKSNGFPPVSIQDTLTAKLDETYLYMLSDGTPAVYRKSADSSDHDWHPMSWHLDCAGEELDFYKDSDELALYTGAVAYVSSDGGFRWSDPRVHYRDMSNSRKAVTEAPLKASDDDCWRFRVVLRGNPFCHDRYVGLYYQRPPYISLQLVSKDYPVDKSIPVWQSNFDCCEEVDVKISRDLLRDIKYVLYCEARDFQRNTLTGYQIVEPGQKIVYISLQQNNLLPGLKTISLKP
jgi:photosystem II stability/assembly factor-like uncharacterized protein